MPPPKNLVVRWLHPAAVKIVTIKSQSWCFPITPWVPILEGYAEELWMMPRA